MTFEKLLLLCHRITTNHKLWWQICKLICQHTVLVIPLNFSSKNAFTHKTPSPPWIFVDTQSSWTYSFISIFAKSKAYAEVLTVGVALSVHWFFFIKACQSLCYWTLKSNPPNFCICVWWMTLEMQHCHLLWFTQRLWEEFLYNLNSVNSGQQQVPS